MFQEEKKVAASAPAAKKKAESSDSDSDSDSSDEEEEKKVATPAAKKKAESSDSDSDEDSSDSDEEPKATQAKATVVKAAVKQTKDDSSSSEESSDDEPVKKTHIESVDKDSLRLIAAVLRKVPMTSLLRLSPLRRCKQQAKAKAALMATHHLMKMRAMRRKIKNRHSRLQRKRLC
ncbi:hypothetical protein RND81_02G205700 [Saponaria officinalis]|uniref:Uncharacterized protein n=1 Tax=Saponaria officinalis TaxID=3572 RepID=A0AAW1MX36_SAPOF